MYIQEHKDGIPYTQSELNIISRAKPKIGTNETDDFITKFDDNTFVIEKGINYSLSINPSGKIQLVGDRAMAEQAYIPEFI